MPRILSPRHSASCFQKRNMTMNEISVALRPFYFAVHPDRFAQNPDIREKNEKSLQIFNGYLNDLFPVSTNIRPTEVRFSIMTKTTKDLQDIQINLSGTDPIRIARHALETCNLCTEKLPRMSHATNGPINREDMFGAGVSTSNIDQDLLKMYLRKKKQGPQKNDLSSILGSSREEAVRKSKDAEVTKITLKDDIDDLKWRTGAKEIVWHMDWAVSHMRRCLGNVNRLLDQSSANDRDTIVHALYKNVLRFGRGSFICCDGSIQFGADNVPEQWRDICLESSVRRSQLPRLKEGANQLRELLGGAIIILSHTKGLAQAVQQIESLITRIGNRPELANSLKALGDETMIEVVTSYDELSIGLDGRLFVPCNVDVASFLQFLKESAAISKARNKEMHKLMIELEADRDDCVRSLNLQSLEWDEGLNLPEVLQSMRRLRNCDAALQKMLRGISVRFSVNPNVYIMNDGTYSIPLNWI